MVQETSEPRVSDYLPSPSNLVATSFDQPVLQSLVVALPVVVLDVL